MEYERLCLDDMRVVLAAAVADSTAVAGAHHRAAGVVELHGGDEVRKKRC